MPEVQFKLPTLGVSVLRTNTVGRYNVQGIPCFLNIRFVPFRFYLRPTLVPVSANLTKKKSKEDFHLYEKS